MSKNKSFSSEILQRYALALYELSKENNQTEEFALKMKSFMEIFNANDDLKNFVKNPTNSVESQKIVFEKILSLMNFSKVLKNFFFILISKKRIFYLDQIIKQFLKLISIKSGEVTGNIITPNKINEKTVIEIEKVISSNIKRSIKLKPLVDESLIGGVVVQIGSLMIDTSIKNKLNKYKKLMSEA